MAGILTEADIETLFLDAKRISRWQTKKLLSPKAKAHRADLAAKIRIRSAGRRVFEIFARKHPTQPNNFSVGLNYCASTRKRYELVRCNGWHGPHPNRLEIKAGAGVQWIA